MKSGDIFLNNTLVIGGKINSGGFGNIWKAEDRSSKTTVAVKELKVKWHDTPQMVGYFEKEFATQFGLSHPHVVQPFHLEKTNGSCFFVMEYLAGGDLKKRIQRQGFLDISTAMNVAYKLLDVIRCCNQARIVHGDIKPSNIIFKDAGWVHPKLCDFGLASLALGQRNPITCNKRRAIMGSLAYMPPEQINGGKLTVKSDIYALGMTLYKMLAGRLFFVEQGLDTCGIQRAVCNSFREKPSRYRPEIPRWIDRLVLRMIAPEMYRRPGSVEDIMKYINRKI